MKLNTNKKETLSVSQKIQKDLSPQQRNETPQVAASVHYYYIKKSYYNFNVIFLNKKRERLFIVVCVKVAVNRLLLLGKIETKSQFLVMRFALRSCWRPLLLFQRVLFSYVPSFPYVKMEKDFSPQYWKIRDLGSNFRNETPQVAASVHYYNRKVLRN